MSTPSLLFTDNGANPDLIDRIAQALPESVRADYYRELSHCRLLPENDEMLRILRAMQFLALLIEQTPGQVAEERKQLALLLTASLDSMQQTHRAIVAHQKQLEQRLSQLPGEIAKGISPEAIAGKINESLRQQFAQSGMPETAQALGVVSKEFQQTAATLTSSYHGVAEQARTAVVAIERSIHNATSMATHSARELTSTFLREYKWSVLLLTAAAIVTGIAMGMIFQRRWDAPATAVSQPVPALQSTPPASPARPAAPPAKPAAKRHSQPAPAHGELTTP